MDFVVFTDESYITATRYRSIASYSVRSSAKSTIESDLCSLLRKSDVREFKWEKLKDAKYRHCAVKLIDYVLESISNHDARIDVVVWDTHDSRHSVKNRNDDANFERMFFHLLSTSMKRRPQLSVWGVYPDEKSGIDWETINYFLDLVGRRTDRNISIFAQDFIDERFFHIEELKQVESHENPLSQVADLFAGLSVFSRDSYEKYSKWLSAQSLNLSLFEVEDERYSNREKARFEILRHLDNSCKARRLGVSLKTKGYLNTPSPKNPINFWFYQPQHERDKAPTKKR